MIKSPILVSVYNRLNHFRHCIASLANCEHSADSHLFIAIDAPYRDEDIEVNRQIINYAKSIKGFKDLTLFIREENYGVNKNRSEARAEIFSKYDRLIMFEDDNIFAPDFLNFVNSGLEVYKDSLDIFSVSGYQYPISLPPAYNMNVYAWQGFSAWGVGIWRDKWMQINWNQDLILPQIERFLKSPYSVYKLNKVANHYVHALLHMIKHNKIHGDGYISLYLFLNNMYSVFPVVSRVRNMGHDGSGVGSAYRADNLYAEQKLFQSSENYDLPKDLTNDESVNQALYRHFKRPLTSQIKTLYRLLSLGLKR